jgi:hypothetical protein
VIDTLRQLSSDPTGYVRTGILRNDLIGLTRHMTNTQKGVKGDAFRNLLGEAYRHPQLLNRFKALVLNPLFDALCQLLRDAAQHGEIASDRLTPVVFEVLHALITKRALLDRRQLTKKDIAQMVDQVLLPLVRPF